MTPEEKLAILKQVESVAAVAGLRGAIDEGREHFQMGFETGNGRNQQLFVRPTGPTHDGKTIITFLSPARTLSKGMFAGLSRQDAIDILQMNENLYFARFGIWESATEVTVVASVDAVLETLDAAEMRTLAYAVVNAADAYEARFGVNRF
jgi:hypothetical protein